MQRRLIFGLLAVVTIWACDSATPSQPGTQAELSVVPVSVSAAPAITTLTITVSGSDIATDLVFNVELVNGAATDTVAVPAGSARTVTVRGYDASNIETHRGSKTLNLVEGLNPQLTVVLDGLTGDQPLVVALGETTVTVTPETATVSVGGTEQLSAVVTDEAGDTLAVSVRWASSNPAIATVDDAGLVTGASAGSATIVGTYGGVGASAGVTVSEPTDLTWVMLDAGAEHTCGVNLGGRAYCWGENRDGQLGDGSTGSSAVPRQVSGGHDWATVSAGGGRSLGSNVWEGGTTCGIDRSGGLFCWGDNAFGQVGDGTQEGRLTPVQIGVGTDWVDVDVGWTFTCAVTAAAEAFCWGSNENGELGTGVTSSGSLTPIQVSGGIKWKSVVASAIHACGLAEGNEAYCWGSGIFGRLGTGSEVDSPAPSAVLGGRSWLSLSVDAGSAHTCGVDGGGAVLCWGYNSGGRLGDGTTTQRSEPTLISGGGSWLDTSVGGGQTCAADASGTAYCWGYNRFGELGDGTTTDRLGPTLQAGGQSFSRVYMGTFHGCGVSDSGSAYCWGRNEDGQLGDGTTTQALQPVQVQAPS